MDNPNGDVRFERGTVMRFILLGLWMTIFGCNQVSGVNDFSFREEADKNIKIDNTTDSDDTDSSTTGTDSHPSGTDPSTDPNHPLTGESNTGNTPLGNQDTATAAPPDAADTDPFSAPPQDTDHPDPVNPDTEQQSTDGDGIANPETGDTSASPYDTENMGGDDTEPADSSNPAGPADAPETGDLSCPSNDAMICDAYICPIIDSLETAKSSCEGVEGAEDFCAAQTKCYETYISCQIATCPPGTNYSDNDINAIAECSAAFSDCSSAIAY